jgi:hypothetical protein
LVSDAGAPAVPGSPEITTEPVAMAGAYSIG